jgi:hypothetical protein
MKLKTNTLEFHENDSPYKKLRLEYESHYDLQTFFDMSIYQNMRKNNL